MSFYVDGLNFSCIRCSSCCRHESGFVFLSEKDLLSLERALSLLRPQFIALYCRWVRSGSLQLLSLKEKSNYDCIFWKDACSVYHARPLQCRSFPFWESILSSSDTWEAATLSCPGIGSGRHYSVAEIDAWIKKQDDAILIEKVVSHW
jgi:Fe-S-cluster containining protein